MGFKPREEGNMPRKGDITSPTGHERLKPGFKPRGEGNMPREKENMPRKVEICPVRRESDMLVAFSI